MVLGTLAFRLLVDSFRSKVVYRRNLFAVDEHEKLFQRCLK